MCLYFYSYIYIYMYMYMYSHIYRFVYLYIQLWYVFIEIGFIRRLDQFPWSRADLARIRDSGSSVELRPKRRWPQPVVQRLNHVALVQGGPSR